MIGLHIAPFLNSDHPVKGNEGSSRGDKKWKHQDTRGEHQEHWATTAAYLRLTNGGRGKDYKSGCEQQLLRCPRVGLSITSEALRRQVWQLLAYEQ